MQLNFTLGQGRPALAPALACLGVLCFISSAQTQTNKPTAVCTPHPAALKVQSSREYSDLLQALYEIGKQYQICFSLEVKEPVVVTQPVHTDGQSRPLRAGVTQLLRSVPGYCATERGKIFAVYPCPPIHHSWLDFRVPVWDVQQDSLQSMSNALSMWYRTATDPQLRNFAGHFRSGLMTDLVGPYQEKNRSVRELLNLMVSDSQGAFWVTTETYTRDHPSPPAQFWVVQEYGDPSGQRGVNVLKGRIRFAFQTGFDAVP